MRLIPSSDPDDHDEPEDGWVSGPRLYDTVVVQMYSCKYTGVLLSTDVEGDIPECLVRRARQHADVDCAMLYVAMPEVMSNVATAIEITQGRQPDFRHPFEGQ